VREFAALGLLPGLDRIAIRTRLLTYGNHLGQVIWSSHAAYTPAMMFRNSPFTAGSARLCYGARPPSGLGTDAIRSDKRLAEYSQDVEQVVARFESSDGTAEEVEGDVLVGADRHSLLAARRPASQRTRHPLDGDQDVARGSRLAGLRRR